MSDLKLRQETITSLENNGVNTVYVMNLTKGPEKGRVLFEVPKLSGNGTDAVIVSSTYVPICLTDQASKEQILKSSEFRKAVHSRRLQIVNSEDAIKILETKIARKEVERLFKEKEEFMNTVMQLDDNSVTTDAELNRGMSDIMNGSDSSAKVNASVLQLVVDLEENKDQDSAINTLRNIDGLKRRDYRYVYKNVSSKFKELIKYCKASAEKLKTK